MNATIDGVGESKAKQIKSNQLISRLMGGGARGLGVACPKIGQPLAAIVATAATDEVVKRGRVAVAATGPILQIHNHNNLGRSFSLFWLMAISSSVAATSMDQMESYVTATGGNSKRNLIEDSVTKVNSDGEPLLTMVAGLSGLLTGIIILAVLVSMVACRNHKNKRRHSQTTGAAATNMATMTPPSVGKGNLNAAFAESTLSLHVQDKDKDKEWPSTVVAVERERY